MKIAMLLAVYHEEKRIRECILHHLLYVDEVVCIHDGPCSDTTVRIAAELGARVIETPKRMGYCEPVREYARLEAMRHGCTWGLVVDADEKYDVHFLREVRRLIANAEHAGVVALILNRITHFSPPGVRDDLFLDMQLRIFRLPNGHFTDVIHTNATLHGGRVEYLPQEFLMEHWCSYDPLEKKAERYHEIIRGLLVKYRDNSEVSRHLRAALGGAE